jgi:hypothetical protein
MGARAGGPAEGGLPTEPPGMGSTTEPKLINSLAVPTGPNPAGRTGPPQGNRSPPQRAWFSRDPQIALRPLQGRPNVVPQYDRGKRPSRPASQRPKRLRPEAGGGEQQRTCPAPLGEYRVRSNPRREDLPSTKYWGIPRSEDNDAPRSGTVPPPLLSPPISAIATRSEAP